MTTMPTFGRYDGYTVEVIYNWPDRAALTVEYLDGPETGRQVLAPQHRVEISEYDG